MHNVTQILPNETNILGIIIMNNNKIKHGSYIYNLIFLIMV